MILHLFDDEKVVNRAVDLFEEAFPGQNIFIVRIFNKPKYVQVDSRIIFFRDDDVINVNDYLNIDNITIHSLQQWKIDFIKSLTIKPAKVWWCIWGADMYNSILVHLGYRMYYEPQFVSGSLKSNLLSVFSKIGIYPPSIKKQLDFIRNNVTNLKTSKEEYEIQKNFLGSYLRANYCENPTNLYYSIDDILSKTLINASVNGNKILVGNSASFSNNHLYVFKKLKNLNIRNKQIVSPLSYGGNEEYRSHVIRCANLYFNTKFVPLIDFMPLDEYNKILIQSEICIYGNWRQEAMGNILISLYLGAKVFLSKKSPLIERFRRMGLSVFCLEEMTQMELDTPLSTIEKEKNRDILFNLLNRKTIIEGIRQNW